MSLFVNLYSLYLHLHHTHTHATFSGLLFMNIIRILLYYEDDKRDFNFNEVRSTHFLRVPFFVEFLKI
jgi:hypothetical protein